MDNGADKLVLINKNDQQKKLRIKKRSSKISLMKNGKLKKYIIKAISLLKKLAKQAKKDADNPKKGLEDYTQGIIMGCYSIFTLLKHQAFVFRMDQKELGLADIRPDIDLLGINRGSDIDFGEDNWETDIMNEETIKRYFIDSIALLKEQAKEAKKDADNPNKGCENYNKGSLKAYISILSLLKHQAFIFDIDEKKLGLPDINDYA